MSIQLSTRVMHIKDETTGSYDTVDILKGSGIDDVQINGTSIVEDGVAEIPLAGSNTVGVVRPDSYSGTEVITGGVMRVVRASLNEIKGGTQAYRPVTPSLQDASAFYGLAKAAGDATQSASTYSVGTYTQQAKTAIRSMIGTISTDDLNDYVTKDSIDYAGITNKTYTTIIDDVITTATDETHNIPYYGYQGKTINSDYKYRVTFDGVVRECGSYTFRTYYPQRGVKGVEYIGDLSLYNPEEYSGAINPIDQVQFCLVWQSNEFEGIQIYTSTSGEHTLKLERIEYTKNNIPNSLIYGDEQAPITKKKVNTSSYFGISIGQCNSIENVTGSIAIGSGNTIKNRMGFTLGLNNVISNDYGIAIGRSLVVSGINSYCEGYNSTASGDYAHSEGYQTTASGDYTHAEGYMTTASGSNAHAEGIGSTASGINSHSEGGSTIASGRQSHAQGVQTKANHRAQHVFGRLNIEDPSTEESRNYGNYVEIVGNGTGSVPSNARTLDWDGNEVLAGKLTVGVAPVNNMDVATKEYVDNNTISDIQINGSSILNNGVANIPIADRNNYGVVSIGAGLDFSTTTGKIVTSPAWSSIIKTGTEGYNPIAPAHQHEAAFYGLAKAAGDSTQAASTYSVGTYTDDAKIAIKSMIGVIDPAVNDVQINGTSILNQGVANIPLASSTVAGVVKVTNNTYTGIGTNNGTIFIVKATDDEVKAGVRENRPIVPANQNKAVFYGLATAASDTTQSASSNAVGIYTDAAKIAIQKMLGIYEPPFELLNDITLDEEEAIDLTADSNGTPYNLLSAYIYVEYPPDLTTVTTGYTRYNIYDGNGKYLIAETGRYTTSTAYKYKQIVAEKKANTAFCYYTRQETLGGNGVWVSKGFGTSKGAVADYGNIVRIMNPSGDVEPSGTKIKVYGQRAY